MNREKMTLQNRLKSFRYAFEGLHTLLREEPNARIQIFLSILVIAAGILLHISAMKWIALFFAVGFVISAEAFNSAIENLSDFVSPEKHGQIKKVKDLAAAGVLIAAVTALLIGLVVFLPEILTRINL